jgi:hypothetical protein
MEDTTPATPGAGCGYGLFHDFREDEDPWSTRAARLIHDGKPRPEMSGRGSSSRSWNYGRDTSAKASRGDRGQPLAIKFVKALTGLNREHKPSRECLLLHEAAFGNGGRA